MTGVGGGATVVVRGGGATVVVVAVVTTSEGTFVLSKSVQENPTVVKARVFRHTRRRGARRRSFDPLKLIILEDHR